MSDPFPDFSNVAAAYDLVADEYVRRIYDELQHKPLDRALLDRFSRTIPPDRPVCDMGCGPGHVARYLGEKGLRVCGVDLSRAMVLRARRLNPGIEFLQGNMLSLGTSDRTWAGMTAFYSLIHIPRPQMISALGELERVLEPGAPLLAAFHLGEGLIHMDEWWGQRVSIDFFLFRSDEMSGYLRTAGFEIEEVIERDPYPDVEYQGRRSYIFARRPS